MEIAKKIISELEHLKPSKKLLNIDTNINEAAYAHGIKLTRDKSTDSDERAMSNYSKKFIEEFGDIEHLYAFGEFICASDCLIEMLINWCHHKSFETLPILNNFGGSQHLRNIGSHLLEYNCMGVAVVPHPVFQNVAVMQFGVDNSTGVNSIEIHDARTGKVKKTSAGGAKPIKQTPNDKNWMSNMCKCFRGSRTKRMMKDEGKHVQANQEFKPKY